MASRQETVMANCPWSKALASEDVHLSGTSHDLSLDTESNQ